MTRDSYLREMLPRIQLRATKQTLGLAFAAIMVACITTAISLSAGHADGEGSPIFGVKIPDGYRKWELIAPSHEEGNFNELRGILGNDITVAAYRNGTLPFPDGAMFAKLAWKRVQSPEFSSAFVPGQGTTVQIMVKDSKRYASTGGWGFGRFVDGKPVDQAQHETCFACHAANVKGHDYVYTRFAP